jgi:hypothetical protein
MKTYNTILLIIAFFWISNLTQAQVVIKNDSIFKTADQMLLANELFESGEPFAEALGYNLDDLDPMVLNTPDSISYTTGIENYEYSRYLLGTVISRSGIGLHMMWSPMVTQMAAMEPEGFDGTFTGGMVNGFNEDDELMMMIGHFGMLANQMAPANPWPQFAEFENGNMHLPQTVAPNFQMDFSTLRWDRNKMDKTLNLAAMGQTMLKQYFWAKDMLGAFHDGEDNTIEADGTNSPDFSDSPYFDASNNIYYGGNNLDGFIGQVLTAESVNKAMFTINSLAYDGTSLGMVDPMTYDPANGIKYFPHRISVTETMVNGMLPPKADELNVTDASSHLFDQLSFLWATLSFQNMMNPSINDASHYAYHEVFDGDPFPAPMSVTGMPGPFDLMMGTSKIFLMNTLAMHFDVTEGTFVDVSGLNTSGEVVQENTISAENAGYILVVLAKAVEEFATMPLANMTTDALVAQTNFILNNLKDDNGGFYNNFTIGTGASDSPKTLTAQASIIRGLYAAYISTGDNTYLQAANDTYNFLINNFYVSPLQAFKTEINSNIANYTPFDLAVISGALREASIVGNQADAAAILTRVSKSVNNKMLLAEAEQSGETGNDSDGDGIPYISGGTLPFVFAAEASFDLTTYQQQVDVQQGWSIISSYVDPFSPALESLLGENNNAVSIMISKQGIYWPSQNINLIGNWNSYEGYKVKAAENVSISFDGLLANNSVNLPAGVSYLPVLSQNPVDNSVLADLGTNLRFAFNIQDGTIYWPEGGIFTLAVLEPGKGYLVIMNSTATAVFPQNSLKTGAKNQKVSFAYNTPWNDVSKTGEIHLISIDKAALLDFQYGDVIGAFNADGQNVGVAEVTGTSDNLLMVVYGDDISTSEIDGLAEGENIVFKVFHSTENTTTNLQVSFDLNLNNGNFIPNGTSRITNLKSETLGIAGVEGFSFNVYPNPSNGKFNVAVSGSENPVQINITNAQGQTVFSTPSKGDATTSIDLSGLSKGVYFIHLNSTNGVKVKKILIN